MIRDTESGVIVDVRVIPRARRTAFGGIRGGEILLRVAAPPVEGAANAAVIEFLAQSLGIARRAIQILGGRQARHKRIAIAGTTAERLLTLATGR
jgi:hypothetical protein